ncbi:MAG: sigma factor [Gemmatimonadaceae bacterium]
MNDDALLLHLRQSLAGSLTAARDFALAAEQVGRSVLRNYCCDLVDGRGLLDDVAQEGLMRVWAGLRSCRGRTGTEVEGWIAAVARCAAVEALRGEGRDRIGVDQIVIPTNAEEPSARRTRSSESRRGIRRLRAIGPMYARWTPAISARAS